MIDLEEFVAQLVAAKAEPDGRLAVRDVLTRTVRSGRQLSDALGPPTAGLTTLHRADDLTILNVVWPPKVSLFPHDHRMWAAIGIYGGQEDNAFYRREREGIVASGGKELREGDVLLLGDDAIHAVHNPAAHHTGAIHVYGGDFFATPRSQWNRDTLTEEPWDIEEVRREFARAEEAHRLEAE
jgi:predicted metal-dependent enzyme (double-stranded beta helix superfamily)